MSQFKCRCGLVWRMEPGIERMRLDAEGVNNNDPDPDHCIIPDTFEVDPHDLSTDGAEGGHLFLYRCTCQRPIATMFYLAPTDSTILFRPDHNDPNHPTT